MAKHLVFLLVLFTTTAYGQTSSSSCVPVGTTEMIYRNDALRLAIKRVNDINSSWKDSVEIPGVYVDSIAKALYAVENMEWSPLKDTIRTLFGYSNFSANQNQFSSDSLHIIHPGDFNSYKLRIFSITISSSASWSSSWGTGNYSNTPNDTINYLMKRYGLVISGGGGFYKVTSPRPMNIQALMNQFNLVTGVIRTDMEYYVGDGQYIKTATDRGDILLTFVHACGDCPAGCTYGRMWTFRVSSADCSVTFISAHNWGGTIAQILYNQSYTCIDHIMPVTFSSIKGRATNNEIYIEWEVATESEVEKYVIERAANGVDFSKVGEKKPNRSGVARNFYVWIDQQPMDNNYYRIKSVGAGGEIKYTQIIYLKSLSKAPPISVYPNPLRGRVFTLNFTSSTSDTYSVEISTTTGQTVYTTKVGPNANSSLNVIQLPKSIPAGQYLLRVTDKSRTEVKVLVIQ